MSKLVERKIGDLTIRIDRDTCIGSGNCTKIAPEIFELDDRSLATFKEEIGEIERERLVEACAVCPVIALFAIDADGKQLVP